MDYSDLEKYLESTADYNLAIASFIHNSGLNIVADYESLRNYLFSDASEREKGDFIVAANKTVEFMEHNRLHDKNKQLNPYEVYLKYADPKAPYDKAKFNRYFKHIRNISLDNYELNCNYKVVNSISTLLKANVSRSRIAHALLLTSQSIPIIFQTFWPDITQEEILQNKDYQGAIEFFMKKRNVMCGDILDSLCYLYLDEEYNDVALENKVVFPIFLSDINPTSEDNPILIIEPSMYFIRKWLKTSFNVNRKVTFVVRDETAAEILNDRPINRNTKFITINEFPSFIDACSILPSKILLFANHISDTISVNKLISELVGHASGEHELFILAADIQIDSVNSMFSEEKQLHPNSLLLLPSKIPNSTSPQRKMFVHYSFGYVDPKNSVKISRLSLSKNDSTIAYINNFYLNLPPDKVWEQPKSIRAIYMETQRNFLSKSNEPRNRHSKYKFTNEITFSYTMSGLKSGDILRLQASVLPPENSTRKARIGSTLVSTKKICASEKENWLENIYPYTDTKHNNISYNVREETVKAYANQYINKPVSLKTFLYLHPELNDDAPKYYSDGIKELMASNLESLPLDRISAEDITQYLELRSETFHCNEKQMISVFNSIFNLAITSGNCKANPASPIYKEFDMRDSKFDSVRMALTQKFLYPDQNHKLIATAEKLLKKHDPLGIALLLKIFLGLESNIVCALKWKDIKIISLPDIEFYSIAVRRQLENRGADFKRFQRKNLYRFLPCIPQLQEYLKIEYDYQLNNYYSCNHTFMEECSIIHGDDYIIDGITQIMYPVKLNQLCKTHLDKLKVPPDIVEIPTDKRGTVETNLAQYQGDVFKSNYYHHLVVEHEEIPEEQVCYLLGKKLPNTFSAYYCGFAKPTIQKMLLLNQPCFRRE